MMYTLTSMCTLNVSENIDKLLLSKYFTLQSADLLFQYCLRFCNQAVVQAPIFQSLLYWKENLERKKSTKAPYTVFMYLR